MKKFLVSIACALSFSTAYAQVEKLVEGNSVLFTKTSVEAIKISLIERLTKKGHSIEDRGNSLVSSLNLIGPMDAGKWLMLAWSFNGNSRGTLEIVGVYNFLKTPKGVKVIPSPVIRYTSPFGQSQTRPDQSLTSGAIEGLLEINPEETE